MLSASSPIKMKTEKSANVINYELTTYYVLFLFFPSLNLKHFLYLKKFKNNKKIKYRFSNINYFGRFVNTATRKET